MIITKYRLDAEETHEALSDTRQMVGLMLIVVKLSELFTKRVPSFDKLIGKLIGYADKKSKKDEFSYLEPHYLKRIGQVSGTSRDLYNSLSSSEQELVDKVAKRLSDYKVSRENRRKEFDRLTSSQQEAFLAYAAKEYGPKEIAELRKVNPDLAKAVEELPSVPTPL